MKKGNTETLVTIKHMKDSVRYSGINQLIMKEGNSCTWKSGSLSWRKL